MPTARSLVVFVLMAVPSALSGCSGKSFSVEQPDWRAGFGWEYDQAKTDTTEISGTPIAGVEDLGTGEFAFENRTERLEVFNATAASVEGIPIYAVALLSRYIPDENQSEAEQRLSDVWDALVYTLEVNQVDPTYLDWRNQEVQLSANEGGVSDDASEDDPATSEPSGGNGTGFNTIEYEHRRLAFPLTNGKTWRNPEVVPFLDVDGVFEGKVRKQGTVRVPAGNFTAVRITGTLTPIDVTEIEDGIRRSLESQGGEVDMIQFGFQIEFDYGYSPDVRNFVDYAEVQTLSLAAKGTSGDGQPYDFTYTREIVIEKVLRKFQLLDGVEKPLSFALEVKRGVYSPKPITPASQLAVEILGTQQDLNKGDGQDTVYLGVRIFNSSAGEKRLRSPEASYAAIAPQSEFDPKYDHEALEVRWTLQYADLKQGFVDFRTETADTLQLNERDFPTAGLKQVVATLKEKDRDGEVGLEIFKDTVLLEVFLHTTITTTRQAQNVSQNAITVKFPLQFTGQRVLIGAVLQGSANNDTACPVPTQQGRDCIRVLDAGNRNVGPDERQQKMLFESTQVPKFSSGMWTAEFSPMPPGGTVTFDILVRYRPGA